MSRCLALAAKGEGRVAPNPMVGCVIVAGDRIIGEGYHRYFGGWHAEVNALDSVRDEERHLLKEATMYVSLEPCSHYGKTPPCALRIVKEGVKKVVICNMDPNPKVSGNGVRILKEAGIEVETGVLEEEGYRLNRKFFTYFTEKRPYVTLKWAETKDGYLDGDGDEPITISSDITKVLVHKMRACNSAIMVGTTTAIKDNPHLNTKHWKGPNPTRVTIDKSGKIPPFHRIFDNSAPTIVIDREMSAEEILETLYRQGIQSLIVEGGRYTLQKFIDERMYDEVQIEVGPATCGSGTKAPAIEIPADAAVTEIGGQVLYNFSRK